jgi:hypothetical protein
MKNKVIETKFLKRYVNKIFIPNSLMLLIKSGSISTNYKHLQTEAKQKEDSEICYGI